MFDAYLAATMKKLVKEKRSRLAVEKETIRVLTNAKLTEVQGGAMPTQGIGCNKSTCPMCGDPG